MTDETIDEGLQAQAAKAWRAYLDIVAPFRPQLHRYCRRLTGEVWDAEDLVQEALMRGFASLGAVQGRIDNPRGYLTRIATNLWLDGRRRAGAEAAALALESSAPPPADAADRREVRQASARLLSSLSPQERAALVLKEVWGMELSEIAQMLSTSVGAVKAALHRGRGRLAQDAAPAARRVASVALVDAFVARLDAADLPGLLALMLDGGSIEMPGALQEVGRAQFERKGSWLWQAVNVHPDLPPDMRPPKWLNRRVKFQGEPIVLGLLPGAGTVQGITRFDEEDGKIARIRSYCFAPETAAEVASAFGLTAGFIPYRFPSF